MPAIDHRLLRASWQSWISSDLVRVGPGWLQWLWTLLFAMLLAAGFTVIGFIAYHRGPGLGEPEAWARWYGRNFVVCLTIAALIHALFDLLGRMIGGAAGLRRWPDWKRSLFFAGVPMAGVVVGWPIGLWLAGGETFFRLVTDNPRALTTSVTIALGVSLALHVHFAARGRELQAEQRATEAQLRLMQAQMEPHFLFNTLANVAARIDDEPEQAKQTLGAFTDYLRASLGLIRGDEVALIDELRLVEAYLQVQGSRLEDRLRCTLAIDEEARRARLMPLLVQPLVENAIVHGIEPALEGGSVHVAARVQGDELVIEVQDSGPGPDATWRRAQGRAPSGHGVALANLQERLRYRYGTQASLETVSANPGTLVRLRLPLALSIPAHRSVA